MDTTETTDRKFEVYAQDAGRATMTAVSVAGRAGHRIFDVKSVRRARGERTKWIVTIRTF